MGKVKTFLLLFATAIFALSCGYHMLLGDRSETLGTVKVPAVQNRTTYSGMASSLTSALRRGLKSSGVEVVRKDSQTVLDVAISRISGGPGMLGVRDDRLAPRDILWKVEAEITLRRSSGEILVDGMEIEVEGRSYVGDTVMAEESMGARARREIMDELAVRIVSVVLEAE